MKYQSEIINSILESRGHELSTLHYESECINQWIEEEKGAYPKLIDYQGEWLNYIYNTGTGGEGGGTSPDEPDEPIVGEFPYETFNGTSGKIENVVPLAYKRAILYGKSEIVNDTLQSVNMPVLTTTGKNTLNPNKITFDSSSGTNPESYTYSEGVYTFKNSRSNNQMRFVITKPNARDEILYEILEVKDLNGNVTPHQITMNGSNAKNCWFSVISPDWGGIGEVKIKLGVDSLEPYKSNILTVNEDVTLRSNGDIYDELDLLTGQLTQRIDENGDVLTNEVVKSINLTVVNENNHSTKLKPIEGTMHIQTTSNTIKPIAELEIPVEAITQNLASFIE